MSVSPVLLDIYPLNKDLLAVRYVQMERTQAAPKTLNVVFAVLAAIAIQRALDNARNVPMNLELTGTFAQAAKNVVY